ncbi:MAG: hypothetical protein K2M41_01750 [Muribaculaceae bacterium]|nr:hypothetical protein [Muribaculaceae bacterium]
MKIIFNRFIPFKGFYAINLFGILFVRGKKHPISQSIIRHEQIHSAQIKELGYIVFYILYFIEWLIRLLGKGSAYRRISFEIEAYAHQHDPNYLKTRKRFAQWR